MDFTLEPGARCGGYTVHTLLGQGAMGEVYLATDDAGAQVAFKKLRASQDHNRVGRDRMRREIMALQRLRLPSVARVLDAEVDASEAFVVTEYVDGPTLAQHVDTAGPMAIQDLSQLAQGLSQALQAVHVAGVIHRDIKPSNVMLTARGPVLIDFGIAQAVQQPASAGADAVGADVASADALAGSGGDGAGFVQAEPAADLTDAHAVIGTPGYLAPELLQGGQPSAASDWWSLAALLCYCGTGVPPFGTGPVDQILRRTVQGRADMVGLPARTAQVLMAALSPDVDERPRIETVLAAMRRDAQDASHYGMATPAHGLAAGDMPTAVLDVPAAVRDAPTDVLGVQDAPVAESTLVLAAGDMPTAVLDAPTAVLDAPTAVLAAQDLPAGGAEPEGIDGDTQVLATQVLPPQLSPAHTVAALPVGREHYLSFEQALGIGSPQEKEPVGLQVTPPGQQATRALAVAVMAVPLTAWGAVYPGRALTVFALLVILARLVGSAYDSMQARWEKNGGKRRTDPLAVVGMLPWNTGRAVVGALASALVGLSAAILVVVAGFWLLGGFQAQASASEAPGAADSFTSSGLAYEPGVLAFAGLVAVACLVCMVVTWFGPLSAVGRRGARLTLAAIAPGWMGTWVIVVLCLIATAMAAQALLATPFVIDWSPFPIPPGFSLYSVP